MKTEQVKKINYVYLLCYIFVPLAVAGLSLFIGYTFFPDGGHGAAISMFVIPLLAVLWWIFAGRNIYRLGKKRMVKQLDEMGIDRRQVFYSDGCVVSMDMEQGKIGLLFFWSPFQVQVAPAGRVTKAWTDDGAGGAGFMRGTSRVSFLFVIDGIKIRVNTFISNQRWKMNDEKVLEGISKADRWVMLLDQVRGQERARDMGLFDKLLAKFQDDWCKECRRPMEKVRKQLFALPGVSVGHYTAHKDPGFYRKTLYIVEKKADIPPGMYACGAIQYRCPECTRRVTVLDPFLPVRNEEKHEGTVVFRDGELDDLLWN